MPLINFEINLILTWSKRCFTIENPIAGQEPTFKITDIKPNVPAVTLSTQDNAKLLEQLKSGFKRTINRNKYQPKVKVEQQNRNELVSKKHKKICKTLNYIEHFLILGSTITGCVSISAFASLVDIPIGIKSSAIGLKICTITAGIKKYNSIMKKKKEKHDKMVLSAKSKLNGIELLISKALMDSVISHDEFALMNNALKE